MAKPTPMLAYGVAALNVIGATAANAQNLARAHGFETPCIAIGTTCTSSTVGSRIGPWLGTGPAGRQIPILSTKLSDGSDSIHFPAHSGKQALDLTGPRNQGAVGISETVLTTIGKQQRSPGETP